MDPFDTISPLDFRYYGRNKQVFEKIQPYLSEAATIRYQAKVEAALAKTLAANNVCPSKIAEEIERASNKVTAKEVYLEEDRIKHNIRALVNAIRSRVSDAAKPYVHFAATSHDIICTADAARFKDFSQTTLIPELETLLKTLITLAKREKSTIQIGRTHGQHAEPTTFGYAIAHFISRIGNRLLEILRTAKNLRGKMAGAVGAYNASALLVNSPITFERDVLRQLGLEPSPVSTQVVEAEYMTDFVHAAVSCFSVLANLSDDMRHLQRSEIAEVAEKFEDQQVGSSTMPHKRNPINFENVKSLWKEFMPRMSTIYLDQISEHQRDLTNSASSRFIQEILAALYLSTHRLNRVMKNIVVDKKSLKKNFDLCKDMIVAEPLYILLAAHNHPNAHEYVRKLTLKAQQTNKSLTRIIMNDPKLKSYLKKFSKEQKQILEKPQSYIGIADTKTQQICQEWEQKLRNIH